MCVRSEGYLVEIGVQGQYTINCMLIRIVQVVHVVRGIPMRIAPF